MIPKKDLKPGTYYRGRCRNTQVALWDGKVFRYIRNKFNQYFIELIKHPDDEDFWDVFVPIEEIPKISPEEYSKCKDVLKVK